MLNEQIKELLDQWHVELEKKSDARLEYTKSLIFLKVLASKLSPLKNSASVENKINSLLCMTDDAGKMALKHHEIMHLKEVEYKNARDMAEYYRTQIIELQSRRKVESQIR